MALEEFYLRDVKFTNDFQEDDSAGDLDTIVGVENVRQALLRRIVTIKGTLAHRPDYGAGLKSYQNAPTSFSTQRDLALDIEAQCLRDERVKSVLGVTFIRDDVTPEKSTVILRAELVGYGEQVLEFAPFGEI